jgi:penicillin-binding protein 2
MKEACSSGGTAFPFFTFEPRVACKTGTAEFGDPQDRTHAWLTAYAPVDKPEIVITALVEAGGEGSYIAAPIVKEVMEEWFNKD